MKSESTVIQRITTLATHSGLQLRGCFRVKESDRVPMLESGQPAAVLMLFGQVGSSVWKSFSTSPEYADGKPDPMDRWSHRMGILLAVDCGGRALFPFEGPPWHPFGQWAQRAESISASPLGILMHPSYGLWHAYRFAIALPYSVEWIDEPEASRFDQPSPRHACDRCRDKPCLSACPVNAFDHGSYDVAACADYLHGNRQADCHRLGCLARGACPEGEPATYELAHRQFHMREFYAALVPDPD